MLLMLKLRGAEIRSPKPSSGDCVNRLAQLFIFEMKPRSIIRWQQPAETRTPNLPPNGNKTAH